MPATDLYEWRPAPCPVCADPAARLVSADGDRAELLLCGRCPAHGHLPYRHLAEVKAILPGGAMLTMNGEVLHIGTPAAPPGLNAFTRSVVELATQRGLIPVWYPSIRRHRVVLTAPVPDGVWGWMDVGARSGRILRAEIHPNERCAPGTSADGPHAARRLMGGIPVPGAPATAADPH
ncbi:hypothetical protein ACFQ8C_24940 [Streptomyces sp. NPDC056503]|uniref:hypothetical protein n=1 Tax=Streptomyces sp. NPDC056503 TaxID=3345842 RepID=UPI00368F16B2